MKLGFIAKLAVLVIVIGLLLAAFLYIKNDVESLWYWVALAFYALMGIVIGIKTQNAVTSASNSKFFAGVMGGTGVRMLLSILFIAIYLIYSEIRSTHFIVYYLTLYLLFTIFEIYQLVARLRAEKQSKVDNATP
jgi:hypothetical protein